MRASTQPDRKQMSRPKSLLTDTFRAVIGRRAAASASAAHTPYAAGEIETKITYVLAVPDDEQRPRTLLSLLGIAPSNAREMLGPIAAASRRRGEFPVAVTSELEPELIVATDAPVEFIPKFADLRVRPDEYRAYVVRRWALMVEKWNVTSEIELGDTLDAFIAAELAHPADDQADGSALNPG